MYRNIRNSVCALQQSAIFQYHNNFIAEQVKNKAVN